MESSRLSVSSELIERCRRGELSARQELFDFTARDVHRIICRLAYRDDEPEDLAQEVYLALWKALETFRGESGFSSFLYGICLNVVRKHRRSWARFTRLRRAVGDEAEVLSSGPSAVENLERQERARAVQRALEHMSFKTRSVLVLFEMEGLSGPEIAVQLQIPEKTVWTRLHHARKAFRRMYRGPENFLKV